MRQSVRLATCLLVALACSLTIPPTQAGADAFTATSTLTYLGAVGGQQQFRYDYALTNTGEPLGYTVFRTFFNSDPITQLPSGDRATLVSFGAPAAWGDVFVLDKNVDGQWYVEWNYDFVSPPGPLPLGETLTGYSVTFDWNDPSTIPPYQHAQVSNGSAHDGFANVVALVNLNGTIGGHVTAACGGSTGPAAGVVVMLLHESQVFADATTDANGDYTFPGIPVGTYTVVVVPPTGYGTSVDNQIVSLNTIDQLATADFGLTCQLGSITGTVTGTCGGRGDCNDDDVCDERDCDDDHDGDCDNEDDNVRTCTQTSSGLLGVTVDLFGIAPDGSDVLIAVTATDETGAFSFPNVALGSYHVVIVKPLSYRADATSLPVEITTAGGTASVAFLLTCQKIESEPRSIGYWQHQVDVPLTGKGKSQESLTNMLRYTDLLLVHFNQNIVNPVVLYVPDSNIPGDRMRKLRQLLTVNRRGTMLDRAKQQLLGLLLNVVSGKISQLQVISSNGANVSQAITYANDLIQDGDPANDETAKNIAEKINEGDRVPSGMVPVDTRMITYRSRPTASETAGASFQLAPAYPNPSRGNVVTLGFSLKRGGVAALHIYDVNGRVVRKLAQGEFSAGPHSMTWDGRDESGRLSGPGVYFYRLTAAEGSLVRSVTLNR